VAGVKIAQRNDGLKPSERLQVIIFLAKGMKREKGKKRKTRSV
jgi:hypothetical protein